MLQSASIIMPSRQELASLDEPPFHSSEAAIKFAFGFQGTPSRPLTSRMTGRSQGRGISQLDRAAQAGMIIGTLRVVGAIPLAALTALLAPRTVRCPCGRACCSGRAPNALWGASIGTLASSKCGIESPKCTYAHRRAVLISIYGQSSSYIEIARDLALDPDTVSKYCRTVRKWLSGVQGREGIAGIEGIETTAWREAESALRDAGIVG